MNIITLTNAAADHIKQLLSKKNNAVAFRLSVSQAGCTGYRYVPEIIDHIHDSDIKLEIPFDFDFYLDPHCVEFIQGTEIDFVTKSLGLKQLEFRNPNVQSLCGCGESFNVNDGKENE